MVFSFLASLVAAPAVFSGVSALAAFSSGAFVPKNQVAAFKGVAALTEWVWTVSHGFHRSHKLINPALDAAMSTVETAPCFA